MRAFIAIGSILSGSTSSTSSSPPTSPTSPTTPKQAPEASSPSSPSGGTPTPKRNTHVRSASIMSIGGLIADTVHHEVKLVRYTQHVARYHSDRHYSDEDDYSDDSKSEKEVQRFFDRDWDLQDYDADAEEWEEPDWSQRVREEKRLTNMRKEARI